MRFSLIICTYMRPLPLQTLLDSVAKQTLYPDEILIVDGSTNDETEKLLHEKPYENLTYYKVSDADRGLTKQRNFGIKKVSNLSEIVCFLDDDTVLEPQYFQEIISTYKDYPEALGVGGFITNEVVWTKVPSNYKPSICEFYYDGWKKRDGSRFVVRKFFGLDSDKPPGYFPEFSNGRSVGFLPPSGKTYQVEQLMGGVASYKKKIFDTLSFSEYFEGYGLYEDADFTLRLSKLGKLYINTNACLAHYHDYSGRPNRYRYGKMVVRNGWYVWRVKYPNPSYNARVKWHLIVMLLTIIRMSNVITTSKRKEAFYEALGRIVGWFSLFFNIPRIKES